MVMQGLFSTSRTSFRPKVHTWIFEVDFQAFQPVSLSEAWNSVCFEFGISNVFMSFKFSYDFLRFNCCTAPTICAFALLHFVWILHSWQVAISIKLYDDMAPAVLYIGSPYSRNQK